MKFSAKIKSFQCVGGTEFTNNKFCSHMHSCDIVLRLACSYIPSQNGITECKHLHVTEMGLQGLPMESVKFSFTILPLSFLYFTVLL